MNTENTQICVNGKKLAYIMFAAGKSFNYVQKAIYAVAQPSEGYYKVTDINEYMRTK